MNKLMIAGAITTAGLLSAPAMAADAVRPSPLVSAPLQPAPNGIQGYVGLGGAIISEDGESTSVAAFGGALNVPVGGLNVEFEGAGASIKEPGGPSAVGYARGAAHIFYRTAGFALGGFGGFEEPAFEPFNLWFFGAEAQAYLGHLNLYGQIADQTVSNAGVNSWYVRGGAQLFLTDNILVQGDVKYTPNFLLTNTSATTFGATAEARFAGTPWSVFATGRWSDVSSGGGSITTGLFGIRINVGNGTEHQQYTTGASMNVVPFL